MTSKTQTPMLSDEHKEELDKLTPAQRKIVLGGLDNKLGHYGKSGHLSYRYDVCPVCQDIDSTEENPKCDLCYIQKSCKAPFNEGFRDDPVAGAVYFGDMRRYLRSLEPTLKDSLLLGGGFDASGGRRSGVVSKLTHSLKADVMFNGGYSKELASVDLSSYKVIIWMPDVPNEEPKHYPKKARGAVLICSKVMREGVTRFDSVSRVFQMHGNAVIEIHPAKTGFSFTLVDALGNEWVDTSDISELAWIIRRFVAWTQGAKRMASKESAQERPEPPKGLTDLVALTREVADKVENERGGRYFGNASTRCMRMFPSERTESGVYVSTRNVDKHRIEADDFTYAFQSGDHLEYIGKKPSVDTPIQLTLYRQVPEINFMIHGHAFIEGAPTTENYFPCGDMREAEEILKLLKDVRVINVKNHGFLITAATVEELREAVEKAKFVNVVPAVTV